MIVNQTATGPVGGVRARPVVGALELQPADFALPQPRPPAGVCVRDDARLGALAVLQGSAQRLDLLLQPLHPVRLALAVDGGTVLDVPRPGGVVQRVQALIKVRGGGADAGDHQGFGIPSQRVF